MALEDNVRPVTAGKDAVAGRRPTDRLHSDLARSLDPFIAWIALAFGFGAIVYLALPVEPNWLLTALLIGLSIAIVSRVRRIGGLVSVAALLLLSAMAGFGWTKLHAEATGTEQIDWRRGPANIIGDVVLAEPRGATARLTIDVVEFEDWVHRKRPTRIRVTRRGLETLPEPGQRVRLRAILMPPPDAGYPGGFDFRRQAFFSGLGAVGFALTDPEVIGDRASWGTTALRDRIETIRQTVERRLIDAAPGATGGLAAALIVGKRGSIDEDSEADLRDTGLAHILAISGLHMALFAGTVFALVRAGFALFPGLSARFPIKKLAASAALFGAVAYLVLSGASIATQRAFVMAVVMFIAILVDRPALTLRNVALAALIVLVIAPEAAASASFQMSFAAATALVVVYQAWNARAIATNAKRPVATWLFAYVLALALTSVVAGLATAPYAAYHFNRVAAYGLVANMLAMPAFGTLVMPVAALTLLSLPFGLERLPLATMDWGIGYILAVADMIAGWDGARIMLPAQPGLTIISLTLALYVACIARGWLRLASAPLVALGVGAAAFTSPPDVLIARNGDMIAVREESGLRMAGISRSSYTADLWRRVLALDPPSEEGDFQRCRRSICRLEVNGVRVALFDMLPERGAPCDAEIVVLRGRQARACPDADLLLNWDEIDRHGAMAIWRTPSGYHIRGARDGSYHRPWGLTP